MENLGLLSIVPIVVTILLSVKIKNISLAMFAGAFAGVLIMCFGNPIAAMDSYVRDYLIPSMTDSYSAEVLALLIFIGGFVRLLEVSGGAHAFAASASKFVNNRFRAQIAAWIGGILIFFSDIGSPIIVGPIFQSLFDKLNVSREKLAWILDTTASPLSILVPFLGWGAYIMGLLGQEFNAAGVHISEWETLLGAWPLQFYALLSLTMVPIIAFTGKEFGQMYMVEHRALNGIGINDAEKQAKMALQESEASRSKPMVMIVPLLVMVTTLVGMLAPYGFPFKSVEGDMLRSALITGFVFGAISNIILVVILKIKTFNAIALDYVKGLESVASIFIVLLFAWVLSSVTKAMGGPEFVVRLVEHAIPIWFLPAIIFLASAIISFSTGSSWGTFAIMLSIAVPAALSLDAPLCLAVASVLSGGLFGDHCSPISDTTILSATGAGCELLDHVTTQLPYALMVGIVTFFAYILAGILGGNIIVLPIAMALLLVVIFTVSKIYGQKIVHIKA